LVTRSLWVGAAAPSYPWGGFRPLWTPTKVVDSERPAGPWRLGRLRLRRRAACLAHRHAPSRPCGGGPPDPFAASYPRVGHRSGRDGTTLIMPTRQVIPGARGCPGTSARAR
jgi:hypothetical protein